MSNNLYDFRKLERQYKLMNRFQKKQLKKYFEKDLVESWSKDAIKRFTDLLPDLPYIGGKDNYFTQFLIMTAMLTPIVKIMHEEKIPERKIGQVMFEIAESFINLIPNFIQRRQGKKLFTEESKIEWQKRCLASQEKDQPYDWVCEFVEGGEEDFSYGFNMTRCGNVDFWIKQGLEQYVPYLCLIDWPGWKAKEIEAIRTQTLAHGAENCDFRYVKSGSNCPRGWPPDELKEWKRTT
jgi:hypothetical protein